MINRSSILKAAVAAGVALGLGTASVAHAGGNVAFSIGANIAPGVTLGISNAPYYSAPAYYPPAPAYYPAAPVYYQPAPVYYQSAPVYNTPSVYVAPRVVYARPYAYRYGHGHRHGHRHGNWR